MKPMKFVEKLRLRKEIYGDLQRVGSLFHSAGAILDYVYSLEPDQYFERLPSSSCEYKMMPRRWIAVQFTTGRDGYSPKIHLSLDIYPGNLQPQVALPVKQGRIAAWSRITVSSVAELPDAFRAIQAAHNVRR